MPKLILTVIAALIASLQSGFPFVAHSAHVNFRQATATQCPTVTLSCPDDLGNGDDIPLSVDVGDAVLSKQNLVYNWSLKKGEIKSGQGTASIKISLPKTENSLNATLEISGLPEGCMNKFSCSVIVCFSSSPGTSK